jgi:two-component system NarL family sensor kinase
MPATPVTDPIWAIFLAAIVSLAVFVVAFAAALVISQRRRLSLHKEYSQRVLGAHEEERAWVARELHDDMLQRVAMVRHELDALWATLSSAATPTEAHRLRALNAELVDLGVALRNVAHRLHPTIVDQLGLPRALEALGSEFQRGGLDVRVTVPQDAAIPPAVAHTAYRIAQESLRNIVKHSGVKEASLQLDAGPALVLRISDAGRGFAPDPRTPGLGLASMRERAALVQGTLSVKSRPGGGTTVEATLPLPGAA